MGEGDEVAGGVFYADFFGAVEGGALGEVDFGAFDGGFDGVEIFDFEIEEGGTFADGGGDGGEVMVGAGVGLVHEVGGAGLGGSGGGRGAFGELEWFDEAEVVRAEREEG